jgi:hypothetical protein
MSGSHAFKRPCCSVFAILITLVVQSVVFKRLCKSIRVFNALSKCHYDQLAHLGNFVRRVRERTTSSGEGDKPFAVLK